MMFLIENFDHQLEKRNIMKIESLKIFYNYFKNKRMESLFSSTMILENNRNLTL